MTLDFDHAKVAFVDTCLSDDKQEVVLNLPIKSIDSSNLPCVSIVVVTKNRKHFSDIFINNWKRIQYPPEKLELVVVDDSDDIKEGPILELKSLKDPRISYYYINPEHNKNYQEELKTLLKSQNASDINDFTKFRTIGYKRNYGVKVSKHDFVCMLDDDDYLYDESILARVVSLLSYKKGCVYSDSIAIYNTKFESSYVNLYSDSICEGSMLFTKDFWKVNKFSEDINIKSEGIQLVKGRELEVVKIPWMFNLIALSGKHNYNGRTKRILKKKTQSIENYNLYKTFPETFKIVIKKLNKSQIF